MFEELPSTSAELPTLAEQDEIKIHEIQHVPLKLDLEEIKKLQEINPKYSKLIKNMKTRNETFKGDLSLDPQGVLSKKIQDHEKNLRC